MEIVAATGAYPLRFRQKHRPCEFPLTSSASIRRLITGAAWLDRLIGLSRDPLLRAAEIGHLALEETLAQMIRYGEIRDLGPALAGHKVLSEALRKAHDAKLEAAAD